MIKAACRTNLDSHKRCEWPTVFASTHPYVATLHAVVSGLQTRLTEAKRERDLARLETAAQVPVLLEAVEENLKRAVAAESDRDALAARLRIAEGLAYGMTGVATSAETGVIELLAENARLQGLVADLWRGVERAMAETDRAKVVNKDIDHLVCCGVDCMCVAKGLDWVLEADGRRWEAEEELRQERARTWQAWERLANMHDWCDREERVKRRCLERRVEAEEVIRGLLEVIAKDRDRCDQCGELSTVSGYDQNDDVSTRCDAHAEGLSEPGDLRHAEAIRAARRCLGGSL